ncbi:hypothetical protein M405DRAFT_938927 [Rhizopogon salebrosus TDB-379]|nr:hypothetical protein M405DRAFT_938927 [Rhizopogon salebrosus TDB-379]
MATSQDSLAFALGPGFVGLTICLIMFGVSSGQLLLYLRSFPNERTSLKLTVLTVFVFDTGHTIGILASYWLILLSCRRTTSPDCLSPFNWVSLLPFTGTTLITLSVQSFYTHRIWIISGRNKLATGAIVLMILVQKFFAYMSGTVLFETHDWGAFFSSNYTVLSASASLAVDALITASFPYFLRSDQSQALRRESYIHQLKIIFMEMGLMTCIVSALFVATLLLPDINSRQRWASAVPFILAKVYFNSMLAVLNRRKIIRQRHLEARGQILGLRTLRSSTLHRNTRPSGG